MCSNVFICRFARKLPLVCTLQGLTVAAVIGAAAAVVVVGIAVVASVFNRTTFSPHLMNLPRVLHVVFIALHNSLDTERSSIHTDRVRKREWNVHNVTTIGIYTYRIP